MSHDELTDLLQSMPRETASPGFTARTVASASQSAVGGRRSAVVFVLRNALAIALALAVVVFGAFGIRHHRDEARLQQLRVEQEQIRRELDQLEALSKQRSPRVVVGTSGDYDFMLGVKPRPQSETERLQPVSLHIDNDGIS